jgi:hypothetical protein
MDSIGHVLIRGFRRMFIAPSAGMIFARRRRKILGYLVDSMNVPNEEYWRTQFIFLVHLFNNPSPSRQDKIEKFIKDIIPSPEVIKKKSLVEQQVINLIGQYAANIKLINEPQHFDTLIQVSNVLISNIEKTSNIMYKFIREELIVQLREQLLYMIHIRKSLRERDAAKAAVDADREKMERIRIAVSKVTKEDVAAYDKHVELYRLQMQVIDKLQRDNVFPGCRDALIHALRIEVPTHEMYYKKYMGGGTRSKKSKTRRRRN